MTMAKLLLCPLALCLLLPLPCCCCLSTSVEGSREKQQMRKALALRKSIVAQVAAVSGGVPNGALEGTVSQLRHDVDVLHRLEESLSGHLSTARDRVAITPHAEAAQAVMKSPAYQKAKHEAACKMRGGFHAGLRERLERLAEAEERKRESEEQKDADTAAQIDKEQQDAGMLSHEASVQRAAREQHANSEVAAAGAQAQMDEDAVTTAKAREIAQEKEAAGRLAEEETHRIKDMATEAAIERDEAERRAIAKHSRENDLKTQQQMKEAVERQHREHIEREANVMAQHAATHSKQEQLASKSAAKLFSEKMQVLREAAAAREAACAKAAKGGAPAAALPTGAETDQEECNPCTTNDN
ncbi:unnamed protein product [Vitrella brassicaformis CCMP3155]|uniref:Uncharacterized protein n=2 Tax=Vitrella brassicaformis TaxID=1169539 RepID=A0A0G4F1G8_VITBC|nr:unnamed protein product [Vitrella brassicaformis CCMP3155]|mmetsp:Transcript_36922/g.92591  ORF Transcript_36922/g.92591 Transcript_36922/m.92591 type:complete len:357 (+) Transcript_36922:135-1205(+)|eukprot:CEM05747.1 unnamed protein product [Vitrella brassicaformis CCMP3155]